MNTYSYHPIGVCAKRIDFSLDQNCIQNLSFEGGCPGNLKAIALLLEGENANIAIKKLKGNRCGNRLTSCADQLARALEDALIKEKTL